MKSDVFHAYDPTSVRESVLGVRTSKTDLPMSECGQANITQIGYKLPFSIGSRPFLTHEGQQSQQVRHLNGEGVEEPSVFASQPAQKPAPSSTFCRSCPQYGHALIFPRKCYYEAQCPLPLLFCAEIQHGEKAVKPTSFIEPRISHQNLVHSFLRRLSSTISKRLAKNDPSKERTNFGWRDREEVPYHLRHDRGSQ